MLLCLLFACVHVDVCGERHDTVIVSSGLGLESGIGVHLLDKKRYVHSQKVNFDTFYDPYVEEHAVLIVETVEGSTQEFCEC